MKTINIENFHGIEVKIEYKKVMDEYAGKTRDILTSISPKSGRAGRSTPYSAGWDILHENLSKGYKETVWNRTNWQLTHLLENGHFITNQGALSYSAPRKHIKPAYNRIRDPYIRAMKKVEIKADFK